MKVREFFGIKRAAEWYDDEREAKRRVQYLREVEGKEADYECDWTSPLADQDPRLWKVSYSRVKTQ